MHVCWNSEMEGVIFKTYMVRALGVSTFVEDLPEQAECLLSHTKARIILLSNWTRLDRAWGCDRLVRVGSKNCFFPSLADAGHLIE